MVQYFIDRPRVFSGVQWDGTNFTEVDDFVTNASSGQLVLTNNGDGTLDAAYQGGGSETVPTGYWLVATLNFGVQPQPTAPGQEVPHSTVVFDVS